MKHSTIFLTLFAVALYLGGTPLFAQHGGGGHGGAGGGHGAASAHGGGDSNAETKGGHLDSGKTPGELVMHNTKLASKLQSLLPPGTNLQTAATGFKNLGQFVAAVHVSHNLGIPFDQLKAKMTDPPKESLGKAIQALRPEANAKAEAKKAHKQATDDIEESESRS